MPRGRGYDRPTSPAPGGHPPGPIVPPTRILDSARGTMRKNVRTALLRTLLVHACACRAFLVVPVLPVDVLRPFVLLLLLVGIADVVVPSAAFAL